MEKGGRAAKRSPRTELNEIDRELFGEEELEILQRGHGGSDEDRQSDEENLADSELLAVNQEDFIILEGVSSNESATSGQSNEGKSDSDVQLVQEEASPKAATPHRKGTAKQKKPLEEVSPKAATPQRKGTAKQKTPLEDAEEQENQLSSENVWNFLQLREKNIKKKIEENKLITHMLCWVSHLQFLNETCNNKFAQALIYSVYVNYQKGRDSKLYRDPIYLFMFIKSTFELVLDGKSWVSGEHHVTSNLRGSILFRLLRCIQRRKGNNILINLIFICLCRCLNIPSRICLTLPGLKTEIDVGQDKRLLKRCCGEYHADFSRSVFYRHFLNSVSEGSSDEGIADEDNVASCADGGPQDSRNSRDGRDDDVVLIEKEEFLQRGVNSYMGTFKQGESAKSGKGSRKGVKDETAQFNIFCECYSTSFNKWVSFFFCFNVYYFNFVNFSKYDSSVAHEDKAFHILLPLPKNPEEIKTFRTQRRAGAPGGFARALFMRRGSRGESGSDSGSEVGSENDGERGSGARVGRGRRPIDGPHSGQKHKEEKEAEGEGCASTPERSSPPLGGPLPAGRGTPSRSNNLGNSKFQILSDDHGGKMYIERDNKFFIVDKKSKRVVRIAYLETPPEGFHQGGVHQEGVHQEGVHQEGVHQEGFHQEGVHQEGVHQEGVHQEGFHQEGVHQEGVHQESFHPESLHQESFHPESLHQESFHPESLHQGSYHPESLHQESFHPESLHQESFHPESLHQGSYHPESLRQESYHPGSFHTEGKKSSRGGRRTKGGREPPLYDFEREEENSEIVNSLANMYSSGGKRNLLLNQIRELRVANSKLRGDANSAGMGREMLEYGEITYDRMANPVKASSLEGKYIKTFINSRVYKFLYSLDHYNLYLCINRYGVVRDVSVRHKLRYSGGGSGQGIDQRGGHRIGQRSRGNSSNAIIKGDSHCNAVRNHFRRLAYQINKKKYNDFEQALDKLDDEYLYNLYVTNMIPTEKTDFLKSSYYILKSMLKKNQVIYPNVPVGLFKGENVYLKENFYNLVRREYLENKHYYISDAERPLSYEFDEYSKVKVPLYAQFQLRRRAEAAASRRAETGLESGTNVARSGNSDGNGNSNTNTDLTEGAGPPGEEENFDYIYSRKDKLHVLKTKLFAHLKASNIIELNDEDVCICNVKLKYVIKHLRGVIPYKIVYNNSYFFNKFRKRPNVPTDADKIIIKKKHMPQFKNLYIPQKQTQDEFLLIDKTKQIKNLWKVLCKSILYEQVNKKAVQDRARARAIYRMKEFNTDVDRYFQI